jgi:hypothetical protein
MRRQGAEQSFGLAFPLVQMGFSKGRRMLDADDEVRI